MLQFLLNIIVATDLQPACDIFIHTMIAMYKVLYKQNMVPLSPQYERWYVDAAPVPNHC